MKHGLLVFFGGFLGVGLRGSIVIVHDIIVRYILPHNSDSQITYMAVYTIRESEGLAQAAIILLLNTIACFTIGLCSQKLKNEKMRDFMMTGVLGGLSTLATIDSFFLTTSDWSTLFAVGNILLTFLLGIAACAYGVHRGRKTRIEESLDV